MSVQTITVHIPAPPEGFEIDPFNLAGAPRSVDYCYYDGKWNPSPHETGYPITASRKKSLAEWANAREYFRILARLLGEQYGELEFRGAGPDNSNPIWRFYPRGDSTGHMWLLLPFPEWTKDGDVIRLQNGKWKDAGA